MANKLVFNPFIKGNFDFVNDVPQLNIEPTLVLYVDNQRTDTYVEDGTILKPYKSIQTAIDSTLSGNLVIKVNPHRYDENILIDGRQNIQIEGYSVMDSTAVGIYGTIEIVNSTRIKLKDIRVEAPTALYVHDTDGRMYIDGVTLQGNVTFDNNTNWTVINDTAINGILTTNTHTLYLNHQASASCQLEVSGGNVILSQCYSMGHINHLDGVLSIYGLNFAPNITSSSNTGILNLNNVSFQKADLTYNIINKTGSCPYIISKCNRRVALDILNGSRHNYAQPSKDIEYDNTVSGLTSDNVQDAIDEVAGKLSEYSLSFDDNSSWGSPVLGYYYQTIPASTHGKGVNPMCSILELSGGEYEEISTDRLTVDSLGNVSFRVPEVPDLRFNGKIIIK